MRRWQKGPDQMIIIVDANSNKQILNKFKKFSHNLF